jgi:hypothetical protein
VNRWALQASWWQLALAMGLPPAVVMILVMRLDGAATWGEALIGGLLGGLVAGPVLGTLVGRQAARQREAGGDLPEAERGTTGWVALWGPVPEDPVERQEALRLARHALAERRRPRIVWWVAPVIILAFLLNLAIEMSPWWWSAVAVALGLLAFGRFVLPRRLQRRIEVLNEPLNR